MTWAAKTLEAAAKLMLVVAINFGFFILLPVVHDLMGRVRGAGISARQNVRIVAEIVKPPKQEEQREVKQRIRAVQTSSARSGMASEMAMRFTPDLGVEMGDGVGIRSGDLQAEVFEEGQTDEPSVPLFQTPIAYPDRARELGVEGVFRARYVVGLDGKVESIEIVRSPHPSFTAAARTTLDLWKFKPARNKGVPVRQRRGLEINFELD